MNFSQTRGDFRCGICQQKNVFHCEHDTPYRDQYLGTNDPNTSRTHMNSSRQSTTHVGMHNNHSSKNNNGLHTERNVNSKAGAQGQKSDKTTVDNHNNNTNGSSKTFEPNKKSKSCVIL
jgi:uncharacterized cupredoxin-like copper-binding protein